MALAAPACGDVERAVPRCEVRHLLGQTRRVTTLPVVGPSPARAEALPPEHLHTLTNGSHAAHSPVLLLLAVALGAEPGVVDLGLHAMPRPACLGALRRELLVATGPGAEVRDVAARGPALHAVGAVVAQTRAGGAVGPVGPSGTARGAMELAALRQGLRELAVLAAATPSERLDIKQRPLLGAEHLCRLRHRGGDALHGAAGGSSADRHQIDLRATATGARGEAHRAIVLRRKEGLSRLPLERIV
mmetsp:Transcript_47566/g.136784  ORF Transcript_47566/g.136784 Transcript_47566/m.136784 type:complete len:246 (-) Transcript_47566:843-1580(-)